MIAYYLASTIEYPRFVHYAAARTHDLFACANCRAPGMADLFAATMELKI